MRYSNIDTAFERCKNFTQAINFHSGSLKYNNFFPWRFFFNLKNVVMKKVFLVYALQNNDQIILKNECLKKIKRNI